MRTDSKSQWDHYAKKDTKQGGTQKGIHVKPLTTYLQQDFLHKATWLVSFHCLHVFTGGFIPTGIFHCSHALSSSPSSSISLPSSVTFSSRRSWICASGAWNCGCTSQLAAVSFAGNLHYHCPSPFLHVNSQGHWALRSQPPQMLMKTPHRPPSHQPSANGNGYFFFHIPVNTLPNS